jgi:hypothetical protein
MKTKKDSSHYANWGGFFPHPQLDAALPRVLNFDIKNVSQALPPLPSLFTVSDDITVATLLSDVVGYPMDSTSIETKLKNYVTLPNLAAVCIPPNGRGLNSIPPSDLIYAFVWRLAKYLSGTYPILSISELWDLEDELETKFGAKVPATMFLPLLYDRAMELIALGA